MSILIKVLNRSNTNKSDKDKLMKANHPNNETIRCLYPILSQGLAP